MRVSHSGVAVFLQTAIHLLYFLLYRKLIGNPMLEIEPNGQRQRSRMTTRSGQDVFKQKNLRSEYLENHGR